MDNFMALTKDQQDFRPVSKLDLVIKEIQFRISFKDLVLIEKTVNKTLSEMPKKSQEDLQKEKELLA